MHVAEATILTAPAENAVAVTPNDTGTVLAKALFIGGAGNVKVDTRGGDTAVTFNGLSAGDILPVQVTRVYATDTSATLIVALS